MLVAAAAVVWILLLAVVYVMTLPRWLVRTASRLAPSILFEVPTAERCIALTIDDSPTPLLTREILRVLRKHNCKVGLRPPPSLIPYLLTFPFTNT